MGIPFGILMLLFDGLDGNGFSLLSSLLKGVFFGLFMSLTLVTLHILHLKRMEVKITRDNIGIKHRKVIKSDITPEELIHKLKADPVIGKMKISKDENNIGILADMNWRSMGENISIRITPSNDKLNVFEISSKPIANTALIDMGKNLYNVSRIEKLITAARL